MSGKDLIDSLSYVGYAFEAALLVYIVVRGYGKRLWQIVFYLVVSLGVSAARSYSLHCYGFPSAQYSYCYWTTDLLLVMAAFVVVAVFFRRACASNQRMWYHVRLLLASVFVLILAVSLFSLTHHKGQLFTAFIVEFQQDLYFATLVLNTLLYLMVVKMETSDDQLGMLVCGLGIEFAGPAACLALFYMTGGSQTARSLCSILLPLCDMGMTTTWFYAAVRVPSAAKVPQSRIQPSHAFAEENVYNS